MLKDQHEDDTEIDHSYCSLVVIRASEICESAWKSPTARQVQRVSPLPRVAISQGLSYFARSTSPVENEGILET